MADRPSWSAADIADQTGRVAVVTGANSGLGLRTTRHLAAHGAHVVMACRSPERADAAVAAIRADVPDASLETVPLDLADLASVREAAAHISAAHAAIDILVNNAGVMAVPRAETADGFEMQLGTNHLGHFAFCGLLLSRLGAAPAARIVSVASNAHKMGRIDFDDLMGERGYRKWSAYGQAKLANLLFTYELAHRLALAESPMIAVAAHPGYAATNLSSVGPSMSGKRLQARLVRVADRVLGQSDDDGALPQLYAATAPDVINGGYYGPSGFAELHGSPVKVESTARSHDAAAQRRLWDVSESLTGVVYDLPAAI